MSDLHIEDFFKDAARIIAALYQVFPRPVGLFAEDISGPDEPDEYGVHSPRHQACFAAMLWLADEGYLRFTDTIRQEGIDQAVLSGRCFARLVRSAPSVTEATEDAAQLPASVQAAQQTLAFKLTESIRKRDHAATLAAVKTLIADLNA